MKENQSIFEWMDEKTILELTNENVADIMWALVQTRGHAVIEGHLNIYEALGDIKKKIEAQWKDWE